MSLKNKTRDELYDIWKKRIKIAEELHRERVIDWADKAFMDYCGDNSARANPYRGVVQPENGIYLFVLLLVVNLIINAYSFIANYSVTFHFGA